MGRIPYLPTVSRTLIRQTLCDGDDRISETGMKRVRRAALTVLLSLWGPVVWLVVGLRVGGPEFVELLPQSRYGLLHLWLPAIWAGALPLTGALWLLSRSVGGWVVLTGTVSALLSLGVFFLSMFVILGAPCIGWECSGPTTYEVRRGSLWVGLFLAASSLPVWIHQGIAVVVQRLRPRSGTAG